MKTLFRVVVGLWVAAAYGQQPVPPAATDAEILAGTDRFKYVTPAGLSAVGFGAPTNGVTAAQAETINRNSDASGTNNFAGNGPGLTNIYVPSLIKIISQTRPVNGDTNWFGPWTSGTTTAGIQEAWDSVIWRGSNAGPFVPGVKFVFSGGYFFFTNQLRLTNYWPMSLTLQGENLLNTKLVYAGTATNVSTILIGSTASSRPGSLNIPMHVTISDLGFSALRNTNNVLLEVADYSDLNIDRCNFTSWQIMTNSHEGAGVSLAGDSVPSGPANLVGLKTTTGFEHGTFVSSTYFAHLATGWDARNDHITAHALRFAHIGLTNNYDATSRYSLGACVVREGGLDSLWSYCHFYSAKIGFAGLELSESPLLDHPNFEAISNVAVASLLSNTQNPVMRDPQLYQDSWVANNIQCYALTNSPNYGVLTSEPKTNAVAYGADPGGVSPWVVRFGAKTVLGAKPDRVDVGTDLVFFLQSTDVNTIEINPITGGAGIAMGNADFSAYHSILMDGTSSQSGLASSDAGFSAPKFTIGTPTITSGSGAPSSDEPKGSIYLRTDGSTSTTLYVKTATGGGGWTAK